MIMARNKTNGFDVTKASSVNLADFGGAANVLVKKNEKLIEEIKIELRSRAGNLPKDETMTEVGNDFVVTIGKMPQTVKIKELENKEIIKLLGQDVFNTAANFPIGRLRDYLSKKDFDALTGAPEDGTRSVSFKERVTD